LLLTSRSAELKRGSHGAPFHMQPLPGRPIAFAKERGGNVAVSAPLIRRLWLRLRVRPDSLAALLGLFLLLAQLARKILGILVHEFLELPLALLDIGLLQRLAVKGVGESGKRHLDRIRLVLEIDRGERELRAALEAIH